MDLPMSEFGVFIASATGEFDPRRPKSKKEIKDTLPELIYLEDVLYGFFPDPRFKFEVMPLRQLPDGEYLFVGPDPFTSRKFYGKIILAENGQVYVK